MRISISDTKGVESKYNLYRQRGSNNTKKYVHLSWECGAERNGTSWELGCLYQPASVLPKLKCKMTAAGVNNNWKMLPQTTFFPLLWTLQESGLQGLCLASCGKNSESPQPYQSSGPLRSGAGRTNKPAELVLRDCG